MRYQVGVDIFAMERMQRAIQQDNPCYFDSVFTVQEQESARDHPDPLAYYATRFALKEAAFKALGTHWTEAMAWHQIATSGTGWQMPVVEYTGAMGDAARAIGVTGVSASISSDGGMAFATVIAAIGQHAAGPDRKGEQYG